MKFNAIHKHLLIKAIVRVPLVDEDEGKQMLEDMVKAIGMKAVTKPQCVYVEEWGNEGLTGSINLATSHIAFHIWDETGLLMMDVYSCKDFTEEPIIDILMQRMGLRMIKTRMIDRELDI